MVKKYVEKTTDKIVEAMQYVYPLKEEFQKFVGFDSYREVSKNSYSYIDGKEKETTDESLTYKDKKYGTEYTIVDGWYYVKYSDDDFKFVNADKFKDEYRAYEPEKKDSAFSSLGNMTNKSESNKKDSELVTDKDYKVLYTTLMDMYIESKVCLANNFLAHIDALKYNLEAFANPTLPEGFDDEYNETMSLIDELEGHLRYLAMINNEGEAMLD